MTAPLKGAPNQDGALPGLGGENEGRLMCRRLAKVGLQKREAPNQVGALPGLSVKNMGTPNRVDDLPRLSGKSTTVSQPRRVMIVAEHKQNYPQAVTKINEAKN